MAITDITVLIILVLLAVRGACKGFLPTLIGPASFVIATTAAILWFNVMPNMIVALLIALIGPILLAWIIRQILIRTTWKDGLPPATPVSRISGAILQALWGGSMLLVVVIIAIIVPLKDLGFANIANDLETSTTYRIFQRPLESFNLIPHREKIVSPDQDIQDILADPKIQKLLSDPQALAAIEKKDIATLFSNPLILDLTRDPVLISKMLRVYPKLKERAAQTPAP